MTQILGEKLAQNNVDYLARLESPVTNDFTKIVRFATAQNYGRTAPYSIYAKITYSKGKLAISGVEGPFTNGNCVGSCGQIVMHLKDKVASLTPTPEWTTKMITKFLAIWDEWHLNNMRAGCEHQRATWDFEKQIELQNYTWTPEFYDCRKKAEKGELTLAQYEGYQDAAQLVNKILFDAGKEPKYESEEVRVALKCGYIKEKDKTIKAAGWVDYRTHPEGLLSKPCEICKFPYGSKWLCEGVPIEVIKWLRKLPETDTTPAWV